MAAKIHAAYYPSDAKPDYVVTREDFERVLRFNIPTIYRTHKSACGRRISTFLLRKQGDSAVTCIDCLNEPQRRANAKDAQALVQRTSIPSPLTVTQPVRFFGGRLDGFWFWFTEGFLEKASAIRAMPGNWQIVANYHEPTDYWLCKTPSERSGSYIYTYEMLWSKVEPALPGDVCLFCKQTNYMHTCDCPTRNNHAT